MEQEKSERQKEIESWEALLDQNNEVTMYIKPLRTKHESGWKNFEVGYCKVDSKTHKVSEKLVLSTYSDHIYTDYMGMIYPQRAVVSVNMDCTLDGYIRIWKHEAGIKWDTSFGGWLVSSAQIENVGAKSISELDLLKNMVKLGNERKATPKGKAKKGKKKNSDPA